MRESKSREIAELGEKDWEDEEKYSDKSETLEKKGKRKERFSARRGRISLKKVRFCWEWKDRPRVGREWQWELKKNSEVKIGRVLGLGVNKNEIERMRESK